MRAATSVLVLLLACNGGDDVDDGTPTDADTDTDTDTDADTDADTDTDTDTADTGASCPDGRYEGPTALVETEVNCDLSATVRFAAETTGWTDGAVVFSQEVADPEAQWSDEHDLVSTGRDPCGAWDQLERDLLTEVQEWERNVSTRFSCGQHFVPSAMMAHAFAVYDTDGNLADCLIIGDATDDVVAGTIPRANEPSFDLGACRTGEVTTGTL